MCYVLVMDVYNDKVIGNNDNTTVDTVTYSEGEAISIPVIEDITKDDNFVDVSFIVCVYIHLCICVCICVCTYVCMYVCVPTCVYVRMCVCTYVCMYV